MMKFGCWLIFIACILNICNADGLLELDVDKTSWKDIDDPFAEKQEYKPLIAECDDGLFLKNEIHRLQTENQQLKAQPTNTVDVLLKHILRNFLIKLNVDLEESYGFERNTRTSLTSKQMKIIVAYLNSGKSREETSLREDVREALEFFVIEEIEPYPGLFGFARRYFPYLAVGNAVLFPIAVFFVSRYIINVRCLIAFTIVGLFSVSYVFTYLKKYQEVLAKRMAHRVAADDACSPQGLISEAVDVLLGYIRIKPKNPCLQTYEDFLIEPILLVDPLQTFGEVLTNFLLSPLSVIGVQLNTFFNNFFIDTPVYLAAIKIIFIICVIFYLSGYRVRTIFGTLEPAPAYIHQHERLMPLRRNNPLQLLSPASENENVALPKLQRSQSTPKL